MHIDFPAGTSEGMRSCTMERFAENAFGVLLEDDGDERKKFLRGAARTSLPGRHAYAVSDERSLMKMSEDDGSEAYCRVHIPVDDPGAPVFDFNRLIMVCPRTRLAVEKKLSGQPRILFTEASENPGAKDPLSRV